jgi:hypothetical protein
MFHTAFWRSWFDRVSQLARVFQIGQTYMLGLARKLAGRSYTRSMSPRSHLSCVAIYPLLKGMASVRTSGQTCASRATSPRPPRSISHVHPTPSLRPAPSPWHPPLSPRGWDPGARPLARCAPVRQLPARHAPSPDAQAVRPSLMVPPWNTCNMKHLMQHMSDIYETYYCNICVKHMQYPDKTLATCVRSICNIQIKHLQHVCETYVIFR